MNVRYLRRVIHDQVDRAQSLENEIPRNLEHAALVCLATSCRGTLKEQAHLLRRSLSLLDGGGEEARVGEALMIVKHSSREIGTVEAYGLPPLHCRSKQAEFLNDVLSSMHSELGLPFPCPAVSCMSNEYYFSHHPTNTVYAPLSEAAFLLHMPDFYHELGHLLLDHSGHDVKSRHAMAGAASAIEAIDEWYLRQTNKMGRESAPTLARDSLKWMWDRWKNKWAEEAFCDLFALFAAGPAYAYSNLHLVSKRDEDMYGLYLFTDQEHPAGEARMRLLDAGMRLLGHGREALHIRREWDTMSRFYGDPPPEYGGAFPSTLLQEIAEAVLPALRRSGLRGYSGAAGSQTGGGETAVAPLLNDAWRGFWDEEDGGFRRLEKELVSRLAAMSRSAA